MMKYEEYIQRSKAKYREQFSDISLAPKFIAAFNSGERITVAFVSTTGEVYDVRRGTIGVTTGWKPCFILMGRKSDHGSSYTLNEKDCIVSMDAWRKWKRKEKEMVAA